MRRHRKKWLCLVCMCGLMPAFFLKCNRASLNFQRGLWYGLGFSISAALVDAATPST